MSFQPDGCFASLPKTTRGFPIVIGSDPKEKNMLYVSGNSVIIRDIENPAIADVYSGHSKEAKCAKYSPSGFYIASADVSGKVRIWDTTNQEHILKNEFQPLGNVPIRDLAWSADSQKIVAGGEGRERYAHCFTADTGNSVGELAGPTRPVISVDYRSSRPVRIITGSEDNAVALFHGPPFKLDKTTTQHGRFVNSVRYSPNGETFASGGADGRAFLYDGTTGDVIREIGNPAHKGGIYGICFSPDGKKLLTCSGDKTSRIFDIESGSQLHEFVFGKDLNDMQVGCLWQGEHIISVSLSGWINNVDINGGPIKSVKGHNKPITAITYCSNFRTLYTAASDGQVCAWNVDTGVSEMVSGKGHSNQIQALANFGERSLVSIGMDDTLNVINIETKAFDGSSIKLPSSPRTLSVCGDLTIVVGQSELVLCKDGAIIGTTKVNYEPFDVSIHPNGMEVAVGSGTDNKVHIYKLSGSKLDEVSTLEQMSGVCCLAYSPDGNFLATGNLNRRVRVYTLPDYKSIVTSEWTNHRARINTMAWAPDSKHLATGGLDTDVYVWNPDKRSEIIEIKNAHPLNQVTSVCWLDNNRLASACQGACVRFWKFNY